MENWIIIALNIQAIITGFWLGDQLDGVETPRETLKVIGIAVILWFFGIPVVILVLLWALLCRFFNFMNLSFVWEFIIRGKELNYSVEGLQEMEKIVERLHPKWYQLNQHIFLYCHRWIKKKYYIEGSIIDPPEFN